MSRIRNRLRFWTNNSGTARLAPERAANSGRQRGFTLIELLLALILLLLLLGAAVLNFSSMGRGSQLDEGATRLESALRYARAHAANSGRKVVLMIDSPLLTDPTAEPSDMFFSQETDPMTQPGQWTKLSGPAWDLSALHDLVRVDEVRPLDSYSAQPASPTGPAFTATGAASGQDASAAAAASPAATLIEVMFYPDGTSDSVEWVLASQSPEDHRRLLVQLIGMTGGIRRLGLAPVEDANHPVPETEPEPAAAPASGAAAAGEY